jgi:hypothetical protein
MKRHGPSRRRHLTADKFPVIQVLTEAHFKALNLSVDPMTDQLEYDWAVIRLILDANKDIELGSEAAIEEFLGIWYVYLRSRGYHHPVAEQRFVIPDRLTLIELIRLQPASELIH